MPRALNRARLSSNDHTWRTPRALFSDLDGEFGFTLDAAADHDSALCARYFSAKDNAIWQRWDDVVWCNPPYHGNLPLFLQKAFLSSQDGATVVCLVPARTDTAWWHTYAMQAAEIRFVVGRLCFGDAGPAPFPSALVIFRPGAKGPPQVSSYKPPGRGREG